MIEYQVLVNSKWCENWTVYGENVEHALEVARQEQGKYGVQGYLEVTDIRQKCKICGLRHTRCCKHA